ncbi:SnoaL-like domain protein [Posidoniimonas corsicana]|uniref:SnoaL-like domain protein n=1 Tax=Posidoniimonas corsicana TaxID=1938618 RepID=A0A5C5VCJ1_9BACT|nr:SgcJ/EcaC family oxidoreductase [Posidoniimonas corsicana]TWT35981.1 SnoaL-like domain protein [Posidoniimonas corsicana]
MTRTTLMLTLAVSSALIGQHAYGDHAADEALIRKSVADYVGAFNRGDAAAVAALWSPEAVYTDPGSGEQLVGREAIKAQFSGVFASGDSPTLAATTDSIEFVSPNVAIERGTAVVKLLGDQQEETQYTAVYVRRDGKWLLDRVSEEQSEAASSNYDHLKELEWMIGEWVDRDDQAVVATSCQWTKNRNFITRMFGVSIGDRTDFSGLQIIGWDPAAKQLRSWVFDSDGGFGQGAWTRKGDSWHIHTTGVAPDGSQSSALNVITRVDDNTLTWQSLDRKAGGELLPNVDEVVVVRQTDAE